MRLQTRIKRRIERLEAAVGKGQRNCAYCRFTLRYSAPDSNRTAALPEEILVGWCEFCRSRYTVSLKHLSQGEREMTRLKESFVMEDSYINPKARAVGLWWLARYERNGIGDFNIIPNKAKKDPKVRMLIKLHGEMKELINGKRNELEAKYGDSPFPEQSQLIKSITKRESRNKSIGVHVPELFNLEQEETYYLIFAELEKIIRGELLPETASALEDVKRRISEAIGGVMQKKQRHEDEERRKAEESLQRIRDEEAGNSAKKRYFESLVKRGRMLRPSSYR